jgi:hypothetical protein
MLLLCLTVREAMLGPDSLPLQVVYWKHHNAHKGLTKGLLLNIVFGWLGQLGGLMI